jgi:uncharacterized protein
VSRNLFVDTSAVYAVLDRDDRSHRQAAETWNALLDALTEDRVRCHTHGSVLVELSALVQRRLGLDALRALHDRVLPLVDVRWVDANLHRRAVAALLASGRRDVSLVDWTSFEMMREDGIDAYFAFDDDFVVQGFEPWAPS